MHQSKHLKQRATSPVMIKTAQSALFRTWTRLWKSSIQTANSQTSFCRTLDSRVKVLAVWKARHHLRIFWTRNTQRWQWPYILHLFGLHCLHFEDFEGKRKDGWCASAQTYEKTSDCWSHVSLLRCWMCGDSATHVLARKAAVSTALLCMGATLVCYGLSCRHSVGSVAGPGEHRSITNIFKWF